MLKHDQYQIFRNKARKHMRQTLDSFEFWGQKIGRIEGDIKEKFNESRWYAYLYRPFCLWDFLNLNRHFKVDYDWRPEKSFKLMCLDIINNMSAFMFYFMFLLYIHKLIFYNVAYWVAMLKNPDCAHYILYASDYPSKVIFGRSFARFTKYLQNKDQG